MKPLLSFAFAAIVLLAQRAEAAHPHPKIKCPNCCKTCVGLPERVKIEKECWEVECKEICIPQITFPWEKCCAAPRCGKVISVKTLKRHQYECEGCGYKWSWDKTPCCGAGNCGTNCSQALPPVQEPVLPPPPIAEPTAAQEPSFGSRFLSLLPR